jgi:hypothetical protein
VPTRVKFVRGICHSPFVLVPSHIDGLWVGWRAATRVVQIRPAGRNRQGSDVVNFWEAGTAGYPPHVIGRVPGNRIRRCSSRQRLRRFRAATSRLARDSGRLGLDDPGI